jgi:pilus assembly protein CpaE
VVQNAHRLDRDLLSGMVVKHVSGVEVLASGENPEHSGDMDPAKIAQILSFLREQFECVVVNTRGLDDPVAQAAVHQADLVHLVSCLDFLALRRAQWALQRLVHAGLSREMIRLVVNRYDRNPYITLEEAETALDMKIAWTVPLDVKTAQEALNDGVPLVTRSRNGLLSSFENYAADLFPQAGDHAGAGQRKGLFGLFSPRPVSRSSEGGAAA